MCPLHTLPRNPILFSGLMVVTTTSCSNLEPWVTLAAKGAFEKKKAKITTRLFEVSLLGVNSCMPQISVWAYGNILDIGKSSEIKFAKNRHTHVSSLTLC